MLAPKRAALAAVLAVAVALAACGGGGSSGGTVIVDNGRLIAAFTRCPDCNDAVTFRSYGSFAFRGTDPFAPDALLARCSFTLTPGTDRQVQGCTGGIEFAFLSGEFRAFRVRSGWTGRTDTGIGIGSSIEDLLAAQPNFTRVDDLTYLLDDGADLRVEANFGSDRRLVELI